MEKLFRFTVDHPWLALILSLIASLPFLLFLPKIQTLEDIDTFFTVEGDPDIEYYNQFKKVFGHDQFFIVTIDDESMFTKENLSFLKDVSTNLEELDEVRKVVSLSTVDDIVGEEDYFLVQKFLHNIPDDAESLLALKEKAVRNPLYQRRLISEDGATAAIIVFVYERPEDEGYRHRLMEKTFDVLNQFDPSNNRFHVAGWTLTNLRLNQYMKTDVGKFIPLVYLIIIVTIFIIFRDARIVLLSFMNVSLCLSCTMGSIALFGSTMNNVTSIIPPLIMALALADTVHIFTHYVSDVGRSADNRSALLQTLRDVYKPCLLTSATTIAGFLSLRLSHVPLIKDFAFISSMGIAFAFIFSFLFLPAAIVLLPPSLKNQKKGAGKWIHSLLKELVSLHSLYGRAILVSCLIVVGVAVLFTFNIKVETDLMSFFKKNNTLRQSTEYVEKHLAGTNAIDISIKSNDRDAFKDPDNLHFINAVQDYTKALPEIDTVSSLADYMKDMNESFHNEDRAYYTIPETRELIAQYLLLYDSDDIDDFINSSFDHARIIARTNRHSTSEQKLIIEKIDSFLRENTDSGLSARVTGAVTQLVKVSDEMVRSQVVSLTMAVIVISMMMFMVFRSFSFGILSTIPNIFPILMNFGVMGLLGIPLNTATALISAVAIGIAVDDTVHFLYQYREERRGGKERREAIDKTILVKGKAMMTTSIILASGFGVLLLSSFNPTVQFGGLTALIMVSALAGDLLLLPAILNTDAKFLP